MNGVDEGDYNLWRQNFAEGDSGGAGSIPEPGASLLGIAASVGGIFATRTRRKY
jgi:hypothetical protein